MTSFLSSLHSRLVAPRIGLSSKLIFIGVVASLVGVLSSSLLLLNWERNQLVEQAEASVAHLSVPIRASLDHAMQTRDIPMLNGLLRDMARESGLNRIRIISPAGIIWNSSSPADIGQALDMAGFCKSCGLSGGLLETRDATEITTDGAGHEGIISISPLVNHQECFGCHDAATKTLGLMIVEAPIGDLNNQIQGAYIRIALASGFTFILLVGIMVPFFRRFVTGPVAELSKGVAEISAENLDYQVSVPEDDEFGTLANAFNGMRQRLKTSHAEMEQRNNELDLLYQVARVTEQLLELKQTLTLVVATVGDTLGLDVVTIYLWDANQGRFERVANWGMSEAQIEEIARRRRTPGGDLTDNIARINQTYFLPDVSKSPPDLRHFEGLWEGLEGRSYVNVPLKSKGRVVGTMELLSKTGQPLTERDVEVLEAACQQIGIAIDNTSLLAETRRGEREALTLYQLGTQVSSSLDLDQVLEAVATGARQALAADFGMVCLQDKQEDVMVLRAISGAGGPEWKGQRIPLTGNGLSSYLSVDQPVNLEDFPPDMPPVVARMIEAEGMQSALLAPLWRAGQLHGIVAVLSRQKRRFHEGETRLLTRLAEQVVVAIENARLYRQVKHLAVLEERDRLAREMHDNLAQSLGYLKLKAGLTSQTLAQGQVEQAQIGLLELKKISQDAYTDVRETLFSLRDQVASARDLVPALEDYLEEYRAHHALDARFVVDDSSLLEFSDDVAIQLNRIIQESLTNIRKHSGARQAWVRFTREGGQVRITIQDDGRGFDPKNVDSQGGQHIGLQIMLERAASVGAMLELDSQPGRGTRVVIHVPIDGRQAISI